MEFGLQKVENGHHMVLYSHPDIEAITWWCATCDPEQNDVLEVTMEQFPDPKDAMEVIKSYADIHTLGEPNGNV